MGSSKRHGRRGAGGKFVRRAAGTDAGEGAGNSAEIAGESAAEATGESAGDSGAGTDAGAAEAPAVSGDGAGRGIAVEVDRAEIANEFSALAAEAAALDPEPPADPAAPPPAPSVPPEQQAAELTPLVSGALFEIAATFAPAWEVTKPEADRVGAALASVLAYWFPNTGGIEPKYVALLSLGMATWGVAVARREPDGTWRPLRRPPPKVQEAARQAPPAAAGALRL